jgi:diadenylate cyclase
MAGFPPRDSGARMRSFAWRGLTDFFVLSTALYVLLRWSKEARALRFALTIVGFWIGSLAAAQLNLLITRWILDGVTLLALFILVTAFQPELRHAFARFDIVPRFSRRHETLAPALKTIAGALFSLAQARRGALIVIVRADAVDELVGGGVPLGGQVSQEILEAIFRKVSPVHDGATIVQGDQITRVAAILPLTQRDDVPKQFGTRHRAAMGLAEQCDAVVLVASEERGQVTLVHRQQVRHVQTVEELERALHELVGGSRPAPSLIRKVFTREDLGLKTTALALSAVLWSITFVTIGTTVRTRVVPVEFTRLPRGLAITSQSTDSVQIQLRGSSWLLDSINVDTIAATLDLAQLREGSHTLNIGSEKVNAPLGVSVVSIAPRQITVRLERQEAPKSP